LCIVDFKGSLDALEYFDQEVEQVFLELVVIVQVVLAGQQPRVFINLVEKLLDCIEQLFKYRPFGVDTSYHSCKLLQYWLVLKIQDDLSFFLHFLGQRLAGDFLHLENAIKAV
jgi:hypothetical protein